MLLLDDPQETGAAFNQIASKVFSEALHEVQVTSVTQIERYIRTDFLLEEVAEKLEGALTLNGAGVIKVSIDRIGSNDFMATFDVEEDSTFPLSTMRH